MKKNFIMLVLIVSMVVPGLSLASDEARQDQALRSFQPVLESVVDFFETNPKLLTLIAPPEKPGLNAYYINHFLFREQRYDIVMTNSIVTPYRAVIDIETDVLDNKPCGMVSFDNKELDGWATSIEAINAGDNQNCYMNRTAMSGPIRHQFIFSYQALEKNWTLVDIIYKDGRPNGRFLALLDKPTAWFPILKDAKARQYNKEWFELFQKLD